MWSRAWYTASTKVSTYKATNFEVSQLPNLAKKMISTCLKATGENDWVLVAETGDLTKTATQRVFFSYYRCPTKSIQSTFQIFVRAKNKSLHVQRNSFMFWWCMPYIRGLEWSFLQIYLTIFTSLSFRRYLKRRFDTTELQINSTWRVGPFEIQLTIVLYKWYICIYIYIYMKWKEQLRPKLCPRQGKRWIFFPPLQATIIQLLWIRFH